MERSSKKEPVAKHPHWAHFYRQYFTEALLNWELNRQEEHLHQLKMIALKK
ncbi:MAG: hypothetical protein JST43_07030 [Bacteroidetes bacterium]|nr:hypothetical protein [Bacteroidota bacterium]MBS1539707.1 hypothetical protein [Bacteroidota bacterium]